MKKILVVLFMCGAIIPVLQARVQNDLRNLFGPTVKIPSFSSVNSYNHVAGETVTMNNLINERGGTIVARSKVSIADAFYNNGGVVKVGNKSLAGQWAVIGKVDFDNDGHVFNTEAMVRGSFIGSIPDSKLIALDLRNLDFGTTDVSRSDFSFSDVTNAKLERANVTGADFTFAAGLTEQQKTDLKSRGAIIEDEAQKRQAMLDNKILNFIQHGGNLSFIKQVIEFGGNVNIVDIDGETLLMIASRNSNGKPLVELLVAHGADINKKRNHGENALIYAAYYGYMDILEFLLDKGASVDDATNDGLTALHCAAMKKKFEAAQCLIKRGAKLDVIDTNGSTPLMEAVMHGALDITVALLEAGADYSLKNNIGNNAMILAELNNHPEIASRIAQYDLQKARNQCDTDEACQRKALDERWVQALEHGMSLPVIRYYLEQGADCNVHFGENELTALMKASINGNKALVQLLIDKKVDLEARNSTGDTALMLACWNNYPEIAEMLINAGADVNAKNIKGRTALHIAAQKKLPSSLMQLLLQKGADVDGEDIYGLTPFEEAINSGNLDSAQFLMQSGTHMDHVSEQYNANALMVAAYNGNVDAVKFCLTIKQININQQNIHGITPLMFAVLRNYPEVIKPLVDAGSDVNVVEENGYSALMLAAENGKSDMVTMLLEARADYALKNNKGRTASDIAIQKNHPEIAQLIADWAKAHELKKEL